MLRFWRFTPVLMLFACGGGESAKDDDDPVHRLVSPSDGAVVHDVSIPLSAWGPREWITDSSVATVTMDGDDITDPLAILRPRWSRGGGADYLSFLELGDLSPGEHALVVQITDDSGTIGRVSSRFTYQPHPHQVSVRLLDRRGQPRSGRVLVFNSDNEPVHLWGSDADAADPSGRDGVVNTVFAVDGRATFRLPAGTYQMVAAGGLRDAIDSQQVQVDGDVSLDFSIPRVIHTPGWLTADFHVHTGYSSDAFVSDQARFRALATSGLDVAVLSDHNQIRDGRPAMELLGLQEHLQVVSGAEARVGRKNSTKKKKSVHDRNSIGHVNAWPLADGPKLPPNEPDDMATLIDAWRDRQDAAPYPGLGDEVVVQLNHPRGVQFFPGKKFLEVHDLLNSLDYRPGLAMADQPSSMLRRPPSVHGTGQLDFDALEVINRFSLRGYRLTRADWFSLLDKGIFTTGTGNSDSHAVQVEMVGIPVNVVQSPPPADGLPLNIKAMVRAVKGGKVMVTTGPFIWMEVSNTAGVTAGMGDMIAAPDGRVRVTARVQAAPWVPVDEVRLVVDGRVVAVDKGPSHRKVNRGEWTWDVEVGDDAWVLVEAGWPVRRSYRAAGGKYGMVAPGYLPIAFTNPVRIDRDGDGMWARRYPNVTTDEPG